MMKGHICTIDQDAYAAYCREVYADSPTWTNELVFVTSEPDQHGVVGIQQLGGSPTAFGIMPVQFLISQGKSCSRAIWIGRLQEAEYTVGRLKAYRSPTIRRAFGQAEKLRQQCIEMIAALDGLESS